jgi:uncharacterized protein (DUF58 family)
MERHSLRALLGIGLLVILAWLGIALFAKIHTGGAPVALVVVWVLGVMAALAIVLWSVREARQARLERRPERTRRLR